jgi:hypothetical protein
MTVRRANVMRRRTQTLIPPLPEVGSLPGGRWNVRFQPPRQTFTANLHNVPRRNRLFLRKRMIY